MSFFPNIARPVTRFVVSIMVLAASVVSVQAHEFWIDPTEFMVIEEAPIVADIRVGEAFEGSSYAFFPQDFRLFEIAQNGERRPVAGRLGDRPALNQDAVEDGLAIVIHVSDDSRLTYTEMAKFEKFVRHKDAEWTLEAHAERGLPEEGFVELYSRHAKSLVAVGDGAGADANFGLETEITALANPYTDDVTGGMPVALTYQGAPRVDAQIEVFEKAPDGAVRIFTIRTGAQGQATVPVTPGMRYMLDAVVLREPEDPSAAWESLWANLTFAVPAR